VGYEWLNIDLPCPQKINANWPSVSVPENANYIYLPTRKNTRSCNPQKKSIQKKNQMYWRNYFTETAVRGTVISLHANPIRHTLPPEREAFRAVDIVLLMPTQSKITST